MKFKEGDIVRTKHMEPHEIDPKGLTYFPAFVFNEHKTGKIISTHTANKTYFVKVKEGHTLWYQESWLKPATIYEPY